jgi:hypothetical protein
MTAAISKRGVVKNTLSVRDVIEKLQTLPQDAPCLWHWEGQILCIDSGEFYVRNMNGFEWKDDEQPIADQCVIFDADKQ